MYCRRSSQRAICSGVLFRLFFKVSQCPQPQLPPQQPPPKAPVCPPVPIVANVESCLAIIVVPHCGQTTC
jgi:hypothetical protein